jgi:hypothetical protein
MPLDILLLILRIAIILALYMFMSAILYYLIQDVRTANRSILDIQRASARLVVTEVEDVPLEPGTEYRLLPRTLIGRGPACTIVLPDTFASTEHALISLRGDQWLLSDKGSRNGTRLNGVAITGNVVLSSGDLIGIGRVKFRFESG